MKKEDWAKRKINELDSKIKNLLAFRDTLSNEHMYEWLEWEIELINLQIALLQTEIEELK